MHPPAFSAAFNCITQLSQTSTANSIYWCWGPCNVAECSRTRKYSVWTLSWHKRINMRIFRQIYKTPHASVPKYFSSNISIILKSQQFTINSFKTLPIDWFAQEGTEFSLVLRWKGRSNYMSFFLVYTWSQDISQKVIVVVRYSMS